MDISIDLLGRGVLVIGGPDASRRILARYRADGAIVERMTAADARLRLASAGVARRADLGTVSGPIRSLPDLVVWVEGGAVDRAALTAETARLRILLAVEPALAPTPRGHVTLVGGGPGDAELMTVAGRAALRDADVVLYDRLGPRDELARWAPAAELIDVGKTPGHHAVPQREIEALLVDRALRGLRVVRLKGGDSFVFGRGGEEVLACREAGVPVGIVPGVTSAIAVPAIAGIPVTHREVSRAFTVVSGHAPFDEEELGHLAGLGGTLVVLMGVNTLPHLAAGLLRHGLSPDVPLAIVERGFSHSQRTTVSTVGTIVDSLARIAPRSPAVIVIGAVVGAAGAVASWEDEGAMTGTHIHRPEPIVEPASDGVLPIGATPVAVSTA